MIIIQKKIILKDGNCLRKRKELQIMELKDNKFLVAGAGISGIGALSLLIKAGADAVLYDGNDKLVEKELREKMKNAGIENSDNVKIVLGELEDELAESIDICVISPGISLEVPFVKKLKEFNKTIWGEIELAYRCGKGKVIGITGTNGKTTTTALVGDIMQKFAKSEFTVGNIGTPYTLMAGKTDEESVTVAEISSFQLETTDEFHPVVSAVLNITPDHLNRHHTMECYSDVKISICKNQTEDEVCVLNYEDERLRAYAGKIKCKAVFFSSEREITGYYLDSDGNIVRNSDGGKKVLMNTSEMKLVGKHNAENVMAAIAISDAMGVPEDTYLDVIKNFDAIEHR